MEFTPCRPENLYVKNTDDNVFSIVRNYFDVSTTANAQSKVLGTIYVDINENVFDEYTESLDVGKHGNIYIYNPEKGNYLYSTDKTLYEEAADVFLAYKGYFEGENSSVSAGSMRLIYRKLGDTGYYIVISTLIDDIRSGYMENISLMVVILLVFLFVLVAIYSIYSGRLSGPARTLKNAMREVQVGNFDVEVDIRTNDEFQYLGEGFNKMLHDLKYYINQVYEAKLSQNIAEINALKMQIQPHFLYNTLDVIRMTALENNDSKTAELLESLSDQMRYVTDNKDYYDMARDKEDFQAIQLWKDVDRYASDPGSVIYIEQVTGDHFDLRSQGTGVHSLTGYYVGVTKNSDGSYTVSASVSKAGMEVTKYLTDDEQIGIPRNIGFSDLTGLNRANQPARPDDLVGVLQLFQHRRVPLSCPLFAYPNSVIVPSYGCNVKQKPRSREARQKF